MARKSRSKSLIPKVPSLKQILGITKIKRDLAKLTGVPTTASGRARKLKRLFGL
jgi:hypothetical protein